MAKKDDVLIEKLVEIIENNNKAHEKIVDKLQILISKLACDKKAKPEKSMPYKVEPEKSEEKLEESKPEKPKISEEEVRKSLMDVDDAGKYRNVAIDLLSKFKAKVFKDLKKEDYAEFYREARFIMETREKKKKNSDTSGASGRV